MTPLTKAIQWLSASIHEMPDDIRMVYVESSEYVTPGPESRVIACFDLFGFHSIPDGGFDPQNDDHMADLGEWGWESPERCRFDDFAYESHVWLDVLKSAVQDDSIDELLAQRKLLLLYADHDGAVSVVQPQ